LRENCTSGSEGRAEVAATRTAASPDPTLLIGVQHNAPGGKGPRFIDAREGREGLCECRSKG
jgi:hypothetical protein